MPGPKPPLDERIHAILLKGFGLRTRDFSHESVERVMPALNAARAPLPPLGGEVVWMSAPIAFTLPGHYAYISRAFVECCQSDAPVAFALAHEIGHHDLGHTDRLGRVLAAEGLAHAPEKLAVVALEIVSRLLYSRDHELAADAYALDLCRRAGFDPKKCLECFDILTRYALDHHDLDGVYGSDEEIELDPALATGALNRAYIEFRLWCARHRRSHPSLHERRQVLLKQIAAMELPET
jgi:predicted Zn-dependent protease